MKPHDYLIQLIISSIIIVGVYQFYFFTQRHTFMKIRTFHSPLDEKVPFIPMWSWVYSFLYYPAILYLNWIIIDARHYLLVVFSFLILLAMQMAFFFLIPVATPAHWRTINKGENPSERFLLFVQKFDSSTNCFPSMHVSVSMLTALLAYSTLGPWVFLFPILIALSCMFTKQHYMLDLPAGAVLGWVAYLAYEALL